MVLCCLQAPSLMKHIEHSEMELSDIERLRDFTYIAIYFYSVQIQKKGDKRELNTGFCQKRSRGSQYVFTEFKFRKK
jgi:hypothetical protein